MKSDEDTSIQLHRSLADLTSQRLSAKSKDALLGFSKGVNELIEAEKSDITYYKKGTLVFYKAHAIDIASGHPNLYLMDILNELKQLKIVSFKRLREKNQNRLKNGDRWDTKIECTLCLNALMSLHDVLEDWRTNAEEGPQFRSLRLH